MPRTPAPKKEVEFTNRPLKNVFEAADTRQKQAKKRSLCGINEHFELVFNTVAATQIVFQRPAKSFYPDRHHFLRYNSILYPLM
ncbi:MAG: hypothetical protein A4S08_12015 [Proteobacteria bacterium SG_bin4]|nr:MAG: hypothetical protein A4S08_12015 [Proteobacteria bacterium SG_bin4]